MSIRVNMNNKIDNITGGGIRVVSKKCDLLNNLIINHVSTNMCYNLNPVDSSGVEIEKLTRLHTKPSIFNGITITFSCVIFGKKVIITVKDPENTNNAESKLSTDWLQAFNILLNTFCEEVSPSDYEYKDIKELHTYRGMKYDLLFDIKKRYKKGHFSSCQIILNENMDFTSLLNEQGSPYIDYTKILDDIVDYLDKPITLKTLVDNTKLADYQSLYIEITSDLKVSYSEIVNCKVKC